MAAATFTSTITKVRTAVGSTQVVWTYTFTGAGDVSLAFVNLPVICFDEALPFGSAHLVMTTGTAPTSVALLVGNDGINANLVAIGVPHLQANFPHMVDITSGQNATVQTVAENLASMPHSFHNWQIIGAPATGVLTITEVFMGTRG